MVWRGQCEGMSIEGLLHGSCVSGYLMEEEGPHVSGDKYRRESMR